MKNITVNYYQVAFNDSLKSTLYAMKNLERHVMSDPEFVAWVKDNFNNNCGLCLLNKVWKYMVENFEYEDDFFDELVISPAWIIHLKRGDCDDFSLFAKSVFNILGVQSDYIVFGVDEKSFSHIAVYSNEIIIDGANQNFNIIPDKYNVCFLVK